MLRRTLMAATAVVAAGLWAGSAMAGPQIVKGPGYEPSCFKPWSDQTKFFQWKKKEGPYRIALVNGFVGNTWRIQMIKTAKTFVEQPDIKPNIKEFKVVSTGEDVPAQISAINNFIDSGYDAIITDAQNPTAFGPVIKRAKKAGVVGWIIKPAKREHIVQLFERFATAAANKPAA